MKEFNYKKALWITAGVMAALIVVRVVVFFTAKPKITVDYVAEYNRLSLPENYNPEDNAAELYQKAFDAFIQIPEDVRVLTYRAELTTDEKEQIAEWVESNPETFDYFRQASQKPYYWIERFSNSTPPVMEGILLPELSTMRNIVRVFICYSEYKAEKEQFEAAFENLLTCYRVGIHKCRPNQILIDLSIGYGSKNAAMQTALDFLDRYPIENEMLEFIQAAFVSFIEGDRNIPSLQAVKLDTLDQIQQTFVYNKEGYGRWAWRNRRNAPIFPGGMSDWSDSYENFIERLNLCLIAPTQREVIQKLEKLMDLSERIMPLTPWELKNAPVDYQPKIRTIENYHCVLHYGGFREHIWMSYQMTKAKANALVAVLAALRYHQARSRYPLSLQELVEASYLPSLPMDPYSDGPLVYHVTEEGFTLYSVGEDFTDNNGTVPEYYRFPVPTKNVVEITEPDIVYWPVYREEDFPAPPFDPNNSTLNGMMHYGIY